MSRRAKLTDTQREQRRQADRQRLQAAVSALLSSDGWARWVRVRARNGLGGRYSWGNQLLIALQTQGEATYVCGFRAWQQLDYAPRKGYKALRILAPPHGQDHRGRPRRPGTSKSPGGSTSAPSRSLTEPASTPSPALIRRRLRRRVSR